MSPSQQFFPKFSPQQQFFATGSPQQNVGFTFANANPQFMQAFLKMQQSQQLHQNKTPEHQNGTTTAQFPFMQNAMLQNRMIYQQNQQIYLNPAFQQQFLNTQQNIVQQQQKLRTPQRPVSTPPTIAPAANIQQNTILRPDYVQRLLATQQNGSKIAGAKKKTIHRTATPPPPPPPNVPETRYSIIVNFNCTRAAFAEANDKYKATFPDYKTPFQSKQDIYDRLLVYHVFNQNIKQDEKCKFIKMY
jgi:hypothetical protein